jgi:hypothetical protein
VPELQVTRAGREFKDPSSHRPVDYDDPIEAAEIVLFADLLERILDRIARRLTGAEGWSANLVSSLLGGPDRPRAHLPPSANLALGGRCGRPLPQAPSGSPKIPSSICRPTSSQPSLVGVLVAAPGLTIDPAEAERFVERLVVREAGRPGRAFLGEGKPHPDRTVLMSGEPRPPRGGISDDELWQFVAIATQPSRRRRIPAWGSAHSALGESEERFTIGLGCSGRCCCEA